MLTKDLLKFKKQKEKIIPQLIDIEKVEHLEFATVLVEFFQGSLGKTRKEIELECQSLVEAFPLDKIVALGLKKLCFDSLTFESELTCEATEFRRKIFQISAHTPRTTISQYQTDVWQKFSEQNTSQFYTQEQLQQFLYSDLPDCHRATEFKSISPLGLLQKYNVALVQGLIFSSRQLTLTVPFASEHRAHVRQLMRHLKFFQLVCTIRKTENSMEILIDGPLSLFTSVQKYGLQLSSFFPAVLFLPQWKLTANIELGKLPRQQGTIQLSEKQGLVSHYKNYSAYLPEEFQLFHKAFTSIERNPYLLKEKCDEILFDGDSYFFPDFEFLSPCGKPVYCELFHPWHGAALKHRLFSLDKSSPGFIIILGVSKILLKDPEFARQVEQFSGFNKCLFSFGNVLVPLKVLDILKSLEI